MDCQESTADAPASDGPAGDLDRAHLREKNRLLTAKVERLESELDEKSKRIEDLEAEVDRFRTDLATVRSERDRLEVALEEREFDQEPNREDRDEDQSHLTERDGSFRSTNRHPTFQSPDWTA